MKRYPPEKRGAFVDKQIAMYAEQIAKRSNRNVLFYASGFLQKPESPSHLTSITREDINGFMAGIHNHDFAKGLLLILHTPGGSAEAAQTIVDYLRSKYESIDALVPTYAMSAGTMIALGCNSIIMGRQSQLGPTDPQLVVGARLYSAHSIVQQFEEAKAEIIKEPILTNAWGHVLRSYGPALLQEARKSIQYGRSIVEEWLEKYMFANEDNRQTLAQEAAKYFSSDDHGSHGRRINRSDARNHHLKIVDLEEDGALQDEVLTLYHLLTIAFDSSPTAKAVISSNGQKWLKNLPVTASPTLKVAQIINPKNAAKRGRR